MLQKKMNKNILAVGIILLSLTAAVSCGGKKETKKDVVEKRLRVIMTL